MQETFLITVNKQASMPALTRLQSACCLAVLLGLLCAALAGCAPAPHPPLLVGTWQGTLTEGSLAAPMQWKFRTDGTESETLTLPQGQITSLGTFQAKGDRLTRRTTIRGSVIGSQQKIVPLANPIEATFGYQITGDTLTLTQANTPKTLVLTREK